MAARRGAVLGVLALLLMLLACAAAQHAEASSPAREAAEERRSEDQWPEDIVKTGERTGLGAAG
jgi:hypothetical protein